MYAAASCLGYGRFICPRKTCPACPSQLSNRAAVYNLAYRKFTSCGAESVSRHAFDLGKLQSGSYEAEVWTYAEGKDYSIKGAEQLASEKTWQMLVEQNMVNHGSEEKQTPDRPV